MGFFFSMLFSPNEANLRQEGNAGIFNCKGKSFLHYSCPRHGWNRFTGATLSLCCTPRSPLFILPPIPVRHHSRVIPQGPRERGQERVVTLGHKFLCVFCCAKGLRAAPSLWLSSQPSREWWLQLLPPTALQVPQPNTAGSCQAQFNLFCKS